MWFRSKTKLSCPDRLDLMLSLMKTRYDNNVVDRTRMTYTKNETELS